MRGTSRSHKYKPGPVGRCCQIRGYGKHFHQIREKGYGTVTNFSLSSRLSAKRQGVPAPSGAPPAYPTPQLPTLTPPTTGGQVSRATPAAPIWGKRFEGAAPRVLPYEDAFVRSAERAPPVCFSPREGLKTRGCPRGAAGPLDAVRSAVRGEALQQREALRARPGAPRGQSARCVPARPPHTQRTAPRILTQNYGSSYKTE